MFSIATTWNGKYFCCYEWISPNFFGFCMYEAPSAPPSKNAVSAFPISCKLLSFTLEELLKKLVDDQCSSITKCSIYHINHMYLQHFTTVVDWPEIGCSMEVSTMFYICRYCVFTWDGRYVGLYKKYTPLSTCYVTFAVVMLPKAKIEIHWNLDLTFMYAYQLYMYVNWFN